MEGKILKYEDAIKVCFEILDSRNDLGNYPKHSGARGYFIENNKYVAFDNRGECCWMEQFESEKEARRWLR